MSHEPRVLLGPGPSNIHPRVFQAMISPILGYLDPVFLAAMDETMVRLRYLFQVNRPFARRALRFPIVPGGSIAEYQRGPTFRAGSTRGLRLQVFVESASG